MSIRDIQKQQQAWSLHNFGPHESVDALLGVTEEVGELNHAHLKMRQKIRKLSPELFEAKAKDAIGDIVIYLMDYCNVQGWDLEQIVTDVWDGVRQRDWKKFPNNGISE